MGVSILRMNVENVRALAWDGFFPEGMHKMTGDKRFQLPRFPGADKLNPFLAVRLSGIPADQ